jgi:hypothetical protein
MSPEEELQRAARAEQILGDSIFQEAVKEIENALLLGIRQSAFKDADLREKLCQQYTLLHSLVGQFRTHMETGKMAEVTLMQRAAAAAKKVVNW